MNCTNSACGQPEAEKIHESSRVVTSSVSREPPMNSRHTTWRCTQCGHTWGVLSFTEEGPQAWSSDLDSLAKEARTRSRGW